MLTRPTWIRHFAVALLLGAAALPFPAPAAAQRAGGLVRAERADLADMAAGQYLGDVISDSRGSSRWAVRIAVTRIGRNRVRVESDYPRLPPFTAALTRALDTLQNGGGEEVFLLDLSKSPRSLMVTVDGASWSGVRE
jgi:hypothetical protein